MSEVLFKPKKQKILGRASSLSFPIRHDPLKRIFDLFFSLLCLLMASPLLLLIAVILKVTSPGPIFYRSPRLGRGGKIIHCLKFRTMYLDAETRLYEILKTNSRLRQEWNAFQKLKNDPRVTPFGKFLRKNSLDELPQFLNVLFGDLSVVGPRPPTLLGPPSQYLDEIRNLYGSSTSKILSIRPGITGVWQISGRSQIPFQERVKMEERYASEQNLWTDLVVIIKTIPAVLFSKGAF